MNSSVKPFLVSANGKDASKQQKVLVTIADRGTCELAAYKMNDPKVAKIKTQCVNKKFTISHFESEDDGLRIMVGGGAGITLDQIMFQGNPGHCVLLLRRAADALESMQNGK